MTHRLLLLAVLAASPTILADSVGAQHDAHHSHAAPSRSPADSASAALLARQIEALRAATARYADIEAAKRDGYVMFGREERPLMGEHWYRNDLVHQPLDLTRPSTLQYATINGRKTLVGVAFTVYKKPADPIPEGFAGSSDHWHVHDVTRMQSAILKGRPVLGAIVRRRVNRTNPAVASGHTHLTMVHAWTGLDNPDGMFAEKHRALPYLQAGLPAPFANGATENAAWGIALVQRDGCEKELRATAALARLTPAQERRLDNACAIAQGKVLAAFNKEDSAQKLNAAADEAWTAYLAERDSALTPEQKARMASVVEHPMGG